LEKYDVIVVGAGPAGCAAAYDLAQAGLKVVLLDKKRFPRFKPCAGGLTTKALLRLRYSIAPVIREVTHHMVVGHGRRRAVLSGPGPVCALTVRTELDAFCLQKTQEAGAEFRLIKGFDQLEETADEVVIHLSSGDKLSGRYLIGADGAHSQVRKLTQQFTPDRTAVALEGIVRMPKDRIPGFTFDFGVVGKGYGWLFPKGDHVNVGIYTRRPDQYPLSKERLKLYVADRLGELEIEHVCGYPIGTGGEYYSPTSQRIFLVGDAAGFGEPLLGEGIHNAIASGQAAAEAILSVQTTNGGGLEAFKQSVELVRDDVYNCRRLARVFYSVLPLAIPALHHYPLGPLLMNGFAAGLTITECKRALFDFKIRFEMKTPASIAEFSGSKA